MQLIKESLVQEHCLQRFGSPATKGTKISSRVGGFPHSAEKKSTTIKPALFVNKNLFLQGVTEILTDI